MPKLGLLRSSELLIILLDFEEPNVFYYLHPPKDESE